MSEETTLTQAGSGSAAASNSGGERASSRKDLDPTSTILSEKEGDLARPKKGRRRKVSYLTINKIDSVDYKEVNILKRFINERGKILPMRSNGNNAKQQRMVAQAIRRAREMALLPFVVTEAPADRPATRTRSTRPIEGAAPESTEE